ncbi:hypothetical protein KCH_30120 [Kitasatospora cheerisanensis KCTC 2395]|uniref:Uncharacterized protein n=1 Tax=Kitasatospora cheerisanensis KCTC 2395 TaxID=1348663 RepID=A0A066YUK0_9ACTN|nr:hypothetical protein KCH_30120 [Kitasatospora cheerisanensis KCTC 2395]
MERAEGPTRQGVGGRRRRPDLPGPRVGAGRIQGGSAVRTGGNSAIGSCAGEYRSTRHGVCAGSHDGRYDRLVPRSGGVARTNGLSID